MKKRIIEIVSLFMLGVILFTQVGINLFHHHKPHSEQSEKQVQLVKVNDSDEQCTVCSLQSCFHLYYEDFTVSCPNAEHVVFYPQPILGELPQIAIYIQGRGPPAL